MKTVEIDRGKRLRDQPATGHNRFHPDVQPIVTVDGSGRHPSAHRSGLRQGRAPRWRPRDRVPRHRAPAARVHRDRAGARLLARRVHDVVNVPNYVVSALLPEAIFGGW